MKKETKIFAEFLDEAAVAQFDDAMSQDFAVKGALMPDCHKGYSLPIGAVVATKDVIVPAWVGYDIGCGMCALKLSDVTKEDIVENSKAIFDRIYETIPVGFAKNDLGPKFLPVSIAGLTKEGKQIAMKKDYSLALGSLGGGNHFMEIGADENNNVWIIIHSGSRGVGHGIASHYMTLASNDPEKLGKTFDENNTHVKEFNPDKYDEYRKRYIEKNTMRLRPKEGHYGFDVNSQLGMDYIQDMNWALDYALENRKTMITRVVKAISHVLEEGHEHDWSELINRNHNHATERDGLWIHRKGATHAEEGMMGVIPANMRDGSFIVQGKGNPDSLYSSSHGAGRVLGRREAKRQLNMVDFAAQMVGIQALVTDDTLDESPNAYKNIFDVMEQQKDLVEVVAHVTPLINIKG